MNPDFLNPETRAVFDLLAFAEELNSLCLIGGTALTLHLNHRNSLDLDFTLFEENQKLPTFKLDQLTRQLRESGHQVDMITDHAAIAQHKINTGNHLHDFARDYVINGVKVTFFAGMKNKPAALCARMNSYATHYDSCSFSVLSLDGLKLAKTLVLDDRIKSRDLYDLMWLMKQEHLSIDYFFNAIKQYANNNDPEYYKAVLTGLIPLDQDDEGLEPVDLTVQVQDIYDYFSEKINTYEQDIAQQFVRDKGQDFTP